MKKIIVPKSIKNKIKGEMVQRIVKLLILLAVFVFAIIFIMADMFRSTSVGVWLTTTVAVLCIPFVICGVPHKLIDSSYYGKILEINVRTATDAEISKDERRKKAGSIQFALVQDEKGKLHNVEIFDEGQMFPGREKIYFKGDRVVHVYGCQYIRPWHPKALEKKQVCVWCGNKNSHDASECRNCGCSLEIEVYDEKGNRI